MGAPIIFPSRGGVLRKFKVNSVNLNGTGDRATFTGLPTVPYVVEKLLIHSWSTTPSGTLSMTLRDTTSGGGNSLLNSLAGLNLTISNTSLALEAIPNVAAVGAKRTLTASNLYLNASAANGSALTATVTLIIKIL